jgi:hypothetical protein
VKPCPKCIPTALPFAMTALIASVIAFITWLTLGLSDVGDAVRLGGAAGAFALVGFALWQYILSCMRRHCRHQDGLSRPSR